MEKFCQSCRKEFIIKKDKRGRLITKQKYCSKKCQSFAYCKKHSKKHIKTTRLWEKQNPERAYTLKKKALNKFRKNKPKRFNELMMKSYFKNKGKWDSRSRTNKLIRRKNYKKNNPLKKECKRCHSKNNLEIHHEIYPVTTREIKKAIEEGKIYYVCIKCHGRRNTTKLVRNR